MNCSAPLPGDDDGVRRDLWCDDEPFEADDELFPVDGATPSDAGEERGTDPIRDALLICGAVFLVVVVATVIAAWVIG